MANLAPARSADAARLADGEVGEVVVQDELLFISAAGVGVKFLGVFTRAERAERKGLGFPALEQRRAMRPRQKTHLAIDRADGDKVAPIQPLVMVHDQVTHRFFLDVVERVLEHKLGHLLFTELRDQLLGDFFRQGRHCHFPGQFTGREQGRHDAVTGQRLGFFENVLRDDVKRDLALGLANARGQVLLCRNHRLNCLVAELERRVEVRFADFLGRAFKHHHVGFVADIDQVQVTVCHLAVNRVGHKLALHAAHADRSEGAGPGDVTDHQRGGRADDREHVGVVFAIGAEDDALDLDFVVPALGEERANGPVNEPRGEDFLFRRAALAFEITARELPGRRRLLPIIHRQRKELLALFGFGGADGGDNEHGFAQLDGDGAVCLFSEFSGFNDELLVPDRGSELF